MSGDLQRFKEILAVVADGRPLGYALAREAFAIMMAGDATPAQMAGFLMGLRVRGETIEEIADTVLEHLGKPTSLKTIVPDRPSHDRRYVLDYSKIQKELGWAPAISWGEAMRPAGICAVCWAPSIVFGSVSIR